jgi:Ca2+-binding EF-hand superfamily protein
MGRFLWACSFSVIWAMAAIAQESKKPDKSDLPAKPSDTSPRPSQRAEQIVDAILQRMDENKDGKISRAEAKGRIADNFDAIDTNKDGFLDRKELLAMAQRLPPAFGGPGRPGMPPGGPGGFGPRPDPLDFDALDKNADGRLTRDELKGTRFAALFDEIDKNKDGKIDPREWEAYHQAKK